MTYTARVTFVTLVTFAAHQARIALVTYTARVTFVTFVTFAAHQARIALATCV